MKRKSHASTAQKPTAAPAPPKVDIDSLVKLALRQLSKNPATPASLKVSLGCDDAALNAALAAIERTHELHWQGSFLSLTKPGFGQIPVEVIDGDDWNTFGLVSDTHLACNEERLDALHCTYDLFEREGVKQVLHAGNIVDGYIPRINGASVICSSIDDQAQYVADKYPQRKGITTYYITGDDHEGWWQKQGFNFGAYLTGVLEKSGRKDLVYVGHVEADLDYQSKNGKTSTIIKVQHPGGGSAYSRSYKGQKIAESFQGGEKPAILIMGHYHLSNFMNERNIYIVQMPGFQKQTIFGRKKVLRMEVGGALMRFKVNQEDGAVTRCQVEFNMFFDRQYYHRFLHSDKKLIDGKLVLKP